MEQLQGKLSSKDLTTARVLKIAPWIALVAASIPAPLVFLVLFLTTTTTESAAVYLLLAGLSLTLGFALGVDNRRHSPDLPPEMAFKIARPVSIGWNHGE